MIFDIIRAIYQKTQLPNWEYDIQTCITVSKWISWDQSETTKIRRIIDYIFYISPIHYVYLLYFCVTPKQQVPYLRKPPQVEQKENRLYQKIQYILNWSDRELKVNHKLLDLVIDEKHWKKELALR